MSISKPDSKNYSFGLILQNGSKYNGLTQMYNGTIRPVYKGPQNGIFYLNKKNTHSNLIRKKYESFCEILNSDEKYTVTLLLPVSFEEKEIDINNIDKYMYNEKMLVDTHMNTTLISSKNTISLNLAKTRLDFIYALLLNNIEKANNLLDSIEQYFSKLEISISEEDDKITKIVMIFYETGIDKEELDNISNSQAIIKIKNTVIKNYKKLLNIIEDNRKN